MKILPPKTAFSAVIDALLKSDAKTATKYLGSRLVVRATWHNKPRLNNRHEVMIVTFGAPNYLEAKFIKDCFAAGEDLPMRKVQLKAWPKKRK
jgi:hypothetical protein